MDVGVEAEVEGGAFAGGGAAVVAVECAEQLAEAEVKAHRFLETDVHVDRLRPPALARRAEVVDRYATEGLFGFDFVGHDLSPMQFDRHLLEHFRLALARAVAK